MLTEKDIEEVVKGKVGYYWEEPKDDLYPTLEVFVTGSKDVVVKKVSELNEKNLDVLYGSYNKHYHRIIYVFDPKELTIDKLKKVVDVLKDYGSREYEEDKV